MIEECSQALNDLTDSYKNCVERGPFQAIEKVIPVEPFITKKAHTFLTDVLLREKRDFKTMFGAGKQSSNYLLHGIVGGLGGWNSWSWEGKFF